MLRELDLLLHDLEAQADIRLKWQFGLACTCRVAHLLEEPQVIACFNRFSSLVGGQAHETEFTALAAEAAALANSHQGSRSLDGVGHAAVSASYVCAKAIAAQPRQAAEYAAYAAVYGHGGYGATSDQASFVPEWEWQAAQLRKLLNAQPSRASGA
jgi:hypothetical protein